MAKTKISTVAKDLNVALTTVIDFLHKKNIQIDDNVSPNTRVDDSVVALLTKEFSQDKDIKKRSASAIERRGEQRAKAQTSSDPAAAEPVRLKSEANKPRILGKIELDKNGMPVRKPVVSEIPKAEVKAEPVAKPELKADDKPAAAAAQSEPKTETQEAPKARCAETSAPAPAPAPQPVKETPKPEEPKPARQTPVQDSDTKSTTSTNQSNLEVKPEKQNATAEQQPQTPAQQPAKDPEVFVPERTVAGPSLNIVGKIDLDALNQSTRPKKKSNDRRGGGRGAQNGTAAGQGAQAAGDRRKRRRIGGKEKVDVEKAGREGTDSRGGRNNGGNGGAQNGQGRNGGAQSQNGGGRNARKDRNASRKPAPQHVEVSEEDVQKQVKETLARLTSKDKALKKGAKWRKEKREANANREREAARAEQAESKVLKLTEFVTANDLAVMMDVPVNNVIATCMNIGVMVSINQRLDAETINIVAEEFGFKTEYVSAEVADAIAQEADDESDLVSRPPVVTVMGHVDHGKTSLLDYIRHANVIAGEAGGITQHIGSYSVQLADGRHITFLDTPGHEAFTAMRARGAKVTDICIIIVAADDSVMPQTVEAINHASAAGVPIVFAINKIDKPHANPDKIKEELAAMNYLVEEWGGKYQSQDISAKKGIGVEELMEKVLLEAEMLELKANPNRNATGAIIESTLDKGRGYVANVLVQNGTLRVGDIVLAGNHFGKVKAMFNERDQRIKEAGPATPALILGLNGAPTAGDTFNVLDSEQEAREIANKRMQLQREQGLRTTKILTLEDIGRRRAIGNFQELNIIVKGDVDGSIEALSDSLIKLSTEEIQVNVLHKAVGEISESDVTLAAASDAIIIGFQVRPSLAARRAAERDGVEIRLYSVIYQAIEEVKDAMAGMLAPEIKEEVTGTAEILETYHISKVGTIAGCMVREGKIKRGSKVRLIREGIVRYTGELGSLKRFKDDVKEVASGYDCGLSIQGYNDIKVGDFIEGFEEVEVSRSL